MIKFNFISYFFYHFVDEILDKSYVELCKVTFLTVSGPEIPHRPRSGVGRHVTCRGDVGGAPWEVKTFVTRVHRCVTDRGQVVHHVPILHASWELTVPRSSLAYQMNLMIY